MAEPVATLTYEALKPPQEILTSYSNQRAMSGEPWTWDEFLVTLDLYLNQNDFIENQNDSKIQETATLIGRSPGAIARRLANYRHLDPAGTKGLENTGKSCREIWVEFYGNQGELAREADAARKRLSEKEHERLPDGRPIGTDEDVAEQLVRRGQERFREAVKERYETTCILCDIREPGLLQAGHIISWSENEDLRGEPENGLLLCYNHHKAFDVGMFTISAEYKLVVRPGFSPESEYLRTTIVDRAGEKIKFPGQPPNSDYLNQRNQKNVYWWEESES